MRRIAYLRWLVPVAAAFLFAGCGVLTKQELKPAQKTLTHGRLVYLPTAPAQPTFATTAS